MKHHVIFLYFLIWGMVAIAAMPLNAQGIAALARQAEKKWQQRQYAAAAALYERAGRLDNGNPVHLQAAGEAYLILRDYPNAANCFNVARTDTRFQMAGLKYARCLKQQGLYAQAIDAFENAWKDYSADQRGVMLEVIQNELAGCLLALRLLKSDTTQPHPTVACLDGDQAHHWAPLPFSDTLLYFTKAGLPQATFMRRARRDGHWQEGKAATGLPESAATGFLSGAFSVDGNRFFFARTPDAPTPDLGGVQQVRQAALYVMSRDENNTWSEPTRLNDYLNLEGSASLWPYVCQIGSEEWLFFASNRAGGLGGFDLYACKRSVESPVYDFSFPMNLGREVNTGADEITPHYDPFEQVLWFSTMGRPGLGGLDIFRSSGMVSRWSAAENAGLGINSPADDFSLALKRDGKGAFLSSNRLVPGMKDSSLQDNLFEVVFP